MIENITRLTNERFPEPIGAYSNGLSIPIADRQLVVLTGQIATNSKGEVQFKNDPGKQTEYIFENIRSLLLEAGGDIKNIIRVVIYVTDMSYFSSVSPVRNMYLKDTKPVSTLVEVNKLAVEGCKVEIEATAII
ncbi:MAG: RidA family protein [Lachnospiraceae bacterium]|nr:RidA family protein [Lachnospiraceae bacterium]